MVGSPEYAAWANMRNRCENENHPSYKDYGARGIRVFAEWLGAGGFVRFYRHIGARLSANHELDRIDNNKGYEPGNVKWSTREQQMRNTRATHWIEIDGVKKHSASGQQRAISTKPRSFIASSAACQSETLS